MIDYESENQQQLKILAHIAWLRKENRLSKKNGGSVGNQYTESYAVRKRRSTAASACACDFQYL